jgi:hypothetical protein
MNLKERHKGFLTKLFVSHFVNSIESYVKKKEKVMYQLASEALFEASEL